MTQIFQYENFWYVEYLPVIETSGKSKNEYPHLDSLSQTV